MQKVFCDKLTELNKIPRTANAADIGTRHCAAKEIEVALKICYCEILGSSKLALKAVGQRSATSNLKWSSSEEQRSCDKMHTMD